MDMSEDTYLLLNKIVSIYSVFLAVFGTVGNLICFFICLRKSLRKTPIFVFIATMSLFESLSLYVWNMNNFYTIFFFSMPIGDMDPFVCKFTTFIQYFSSYIAAYSLVNFSKFHFFNFKFLMS